MDVSQLASTGVLRQAATQGTLHSARARCGGSFPPQLDELFSQTDGFFMPNGITVYSAEDIVERNETFQISEFSAAYLLIGDNSGGKGFLIKKSGPDQAVYSSDLGDLDPRGFVREASSIEHWIAML